MRYALLILFGLIATTASDTARADQYKYCALYNFGETGGGANCYFVTLQQCQAAVSGVGGFCALSPFIGNLPASSWSQVTQQAAPPA